MDLPAADARPSKHPIGIGAELAQARERLGLSLDELSRRTKLSVTALRKVENGTMNRMAGSIYARAALRAYAREVGCDQEEIVRRYRERFEQTDWPDETGEPSNGPITRTCVAGQVHVAEIDAIDRRQLRIARIAGGIAILLGSALFFDFQGDVVRPGARPPTRASLAALPPVTVPLPGVRAETGTAGVMQVERPIDPGGKEARQALRVEIEPRALCWLSATTDDQEASNRLTDVGETTRIEADKQVVLRLGDAANCGLTINGAAARRLGDPGQPVTLHITRDNYRGFLDP
jgi:transcriptional regulator with XRE-family HTH domain